MTENEYTDRTKRFCCPLCRSDEELFVTELPVTTLSYEGMEDGYLTTCTEVYSEMHRYICANCTHEWLSISYMSEL